MARERIYERHAALMSAVLTIVFFGIFFLAIGGISSYVAKESCSARWEGSGLQSNWEFMRGCRVRSPSGAWLPERAIRDISITK